MTERTAVIVGGGIGGLAAGLALTRRGWQIEVCERAVEFAEIGADGLHSTVRRLRWPAAKPPRYVGYRMAHDHSAVAGPAH